MNPLILHLKQKYYWMIQRKEKRIEYREYKPYWISRIRDQKEIIFVLGYCCNNDWDIHADITNIEIVNKSKLPDYAKQEFKKSKYDKFFAIKFKVKSNLQF